MPVIEASLIIVSALFSSLAPSSGMGSERLDRLLVAGCTYASDENGATQ
jgi:hypothetical protein